MLISRRNRFYAAVVIPVTLCCSAFAQQSPTPTGKSGLDIEAVLGPLRPPRPNMQFQGSQPLVANLQIVAREGTFTAEVMTDPEGHYRIELPPGHYIIVPKRKGLGPPRPPNAQSAKVEAGAFTNVKLYYDRGVR